MRKKIVTLAVVLALASISGFLVSTTVFAAVGSSIVGTDPTGGSCGGNGIASTWWDSCFGYSWQVYDVLQDLPEGGIHFHTTGNTGNVVNITGCKAGQKLYNYGFETYKPDYNLTAGSLTALRGDYSIKYFESGYQVSTQKNKSGAQAPHTSTGAKGVFKNGSSGTQPSANIDSYIRVVGYADMGSDLDDCRGSDNGTAYWKFCKMKEYIRNNPNEAHNFAGAGVGWEDVGAFCWDPGMGDDPKEFYANSKVEANKVGSSSVRMVETGTVGQDSNVDMTLSINAGESVDIVFTHNLYSKYKVSDNESWKAKRTFSAGVTMGGNTTQTVRGATQFNHPGGEGLYAADNNPVLKDTYSSVRFNNPGQYSFCESITINEITTEACVKIYVTTFYANSKVEANKVGAPRVERAETGITQNGDASITLSIKVGESVNISFAHNLYSKEKVNNGKPWRMERDFSAGVTMGGGTARTAIGATQYTGLTTESGMRLYAADNNRRGNPVVKDTYSNVKFDNPGTYSFCETMTVDAVTAKVCVNVEVGDPIIVNPACDSLPWSYSSSNSRSGTTSVVSRVSNKNITGFQTVVYAKPGDTVTWCNAYFPGVQKAANTTVTYNNYDPEPADLSGFTNTLDNGAFSRYPDWTNQYSISSVNVQPYFSEFRTFGIGNWDSQKSVNDVSIGTNQVGQILSETITSGYPSSVSVSSGSGPHSWSCHWKEEDERCGIVEYVKCNPHSEISCVAPNPKGGCFHYSPVTKYDKCPVYGSCYVDTCRHTNLFYSNSRSGTASDTSYVQVPYNFKNTATVNISDSLVYAGETMSISSATVTVNKKWNDVTRGDYATRVDNAQTKLVGYLSSSSTGMAKDSHNSSNICSALPVKNGSCNELNSYGGMTLNNSDKNMGGSTSSLGFAGQSYNVYDATAGDYYCVVVAVYPSTSGSDTNLSASGDGRWYVSAPSCRVIAKRPSFQVWGGSIYSARAVKTSNASKNNLWNVPGYGYATTDTRNTVIFGSWVEQSVISNGIVTGLASGAATGNVADVRQTGSKEGKADPWGYCTYRVPLSIANNSTLTCPNVQAVGNAGLSNAAIDENSLMDYWNVSNVSYINKTTINLVSDYIETTTMQGNRVNYTEVAGNIYQASLTGATIRKGITHVVRTSGNLRIDGNIMYENATYRSQKEIPKLLIYASGNIVINCGVSRIDAIIIAGGQVKTCDSSDNNARANSNQLKVNGMIIADKLIFNRSYGAWAGTGSGVPAEIINYDTSAIVWGKGMAAKSDFDTLTTVYQHEIAPRY